MKNNSNITTVLSLFDGISCARVALERLGYTDILYLASEVDKYAIQIAQKNFPDTIQLGDVRNIKRENLPQVIDLLIGGSPCQDLSIAKNNRKGLDGQRSGLFWEWVRLWRECQPRYWVLENVNSMPKAAKQIISETLGVEPIMINAALVSAQNRKRLFWTNIATDIFGHCHIPLPEDRGILLRDILESGTAQDEINKSYSIDDGIGEAEQIAVAKIIKMASDCGLEAVGIIQTGHGYNSGGIKAADGKTPPLTISAWEHNNKLIIPEATKNALEGYTIRKLTPTECERLMTLPTWEIITEVEICSDLAKNYVNAVNKSPKLQKLVGSVEKIELQQYVEYVGRKLRENNPKTEHIVQENATTQTMNSALNHTENRKTELPMCAKYVGKNSRCPNPVVEEDIVLWNAFISITGGPSAPNGGEVSLLRERHYVTRLNGNKSLRLSGNEIMQLAKDVENGSITKRDNNTTYITLSRLGIKNIELMLIILYYYAVIAIDGCMEKEIRTNYLSMRCYNPYTANGVNVNGKHIAISNTQRYKTLGNGFVVEVVKHILSYMEGLEKGETRLGIKKDTKEEEQ